MTPCDFQVLLITETSGRTEAENKIAEFQQLFSDKACFTSPEQADPCQLYYPRKLRDGYKLFTGFLVKMERSALESFRIQAWINKMRQSGKA